MDDERLAWLFDNWARWIRNDKSELAKLDYPDHSTCFLNGGGESNDNKEIMYERVDLNDAIQMDAIIDGLSIHHQCAIQHQWLAAVWRMRDFETAYEQACNMVKSIAKRRGMN